jgi:hypothetical protein
VVRTCHEVSYLEMKPVIFITVVGSGVGFMWVGLFSETRSA